MAGLVRGHKGLIYPTGFAVSSDTATVQIGYPYQIPYTITPANATNQIIKWTSSNTNIATVDNKGVITAVATGTCTVTGVYSYDGTTVTIAVTTTNVPVTGISLDKNTMMVNEGKFGWLHATLSPSQPSNTGIVWTSSDTSVATVNEEGAVGYVSGGTATITATTVDGGYTATCVVSCMVNVKTFELDTHNVDIAPNSTFQLNPVTTPSAAASEILLNWESSDTSVATVSSSGLVTYVGYGECTITATTADGEFEDTCSVYCGIRVTGVELDATEGYLASGETLQLTETITPSDASNKNVTWSSSNTSVATVSNSGLVAYVGMGTTTITCTTEEGGYTATCTVVGVIPVTGVALNTSTGEVMAQNPLQLIATITPSNATVKTVTWTSSDMSIATVDDTGLVSYVSDGTATITCTTNQGGLTATCTITCISFIPVDTCFGYTGAEQSILLQPHKYCLEVWGAGGGCGNANSQSKGGYSGGCITLNAETCVYIYVGGMGCWRSSQGTASGGRNGGGYGSSYSSYWAGGGGGGTDIRIGGNTLYHRRIVAGGGGGGGCYNNTHKPGGAGGGCNGVAGQLIYPSYSVGGGGTQTSGGSTVACGTSGSFGRGGCNTTGGNGGWNGGGGGGGWYGGGAGQAVSATGGGGSGYVYAATTCSNAPSGYCHCTIYFLTNACSCCGAVSFPSPSGGTEIGHAGCGCVRIRSI